MMKKSVQRVLGIVLVLLLLVPFAGCGKGQLDTFFMLQHFQKACNDLDVDSVLNYIDPNIASVVRTATGVIGFFTGQDNTAIFEKISALLMENEDVGGIEFFRTLKIRVKNMETQDSGAVLASVVLTYTKGDGSEASRNARITCRADGENWYISGVNFRVNDSEG